MNTTTRMTVPSDLVRYLVETEEKMPGDRGGFWTYVGTQHVSKQRWHTWYWLILSDPMGALWGVQYGEAATEYQDHQYPWESSDTVTLRLMDARQVTVIRYMEVL